MGAPKQKWTPEEEAALKAGISKYGLGKWSTILKDPEFSTVLRLRSNVDLKDKWRNLNCMANGLGSRSRARIACKTNQLTLKHGENAVVICSKVENGLEAADVPSPAVSNVPAIDAVSSQQVSRLDDLILEAINKLKEPRGSSRHAIAQYIEEHHFAPSEFEKALAASLKLLTDNRRLIKVKNHYRIAPSSMSSDVGRDPSVPLLHAPQVEEKAMKFFTKADIEAELERMRGLSAKEAVAAAAQAVAEAEAAIAAAEGAAKEAEEAEAEAEAARCFAEASVKASKYKSFRLW